MADYQLSYTGDQVNTAIGQIVNKDITGTLNVETLNLANPLSISSGGTGKSNRADGFTALADYGEVVVSVDQDLPEKWANIKSGIHRYTGNGSSITANNFICNWVSSDGSVTQFKQTPTNQAFVRSGKESAWEGDGWIQLLSTLNGVQIKKVWENASPTSAFSNQTLTLDFSSYDLVIILFNLDSNNRSTSPAILPVGHPGASAYQNNVRSFLVHTNDIQFDSVSPSSAVMIPYVIYGVKGVV